GVPAGVALAVHQCGEVATDRTSVASVVARTVRGLTGDVLLATAQALGEGSGCGVLGVLHLTHPPGCRVGFLPYISIKPYKTGITQYLIGIHLGDRWGRTGTGIG